MTGTAAHSRELTSTISRDGVLRLELRRAVISTPGLHEVVVRVDGAPVNPSDMTILVGRALPSTFRSVGTQRDQMVLTAEVPHEWLPSVRARLNRSLRAGNEGTGVVIAAGDGVRPLLGRRIAAGAGGMFSDFRSLPASACTPLPDDATPQGSASLAINPMTVLAMLATMRQEGHRALVHTAAASNLGRMLARTCQQDGIEAVHVVRSPGQAETLRALGAVHVVDSSLDRYDEALVEAVGATGATVAFDAIGGGHMADAILRAMEIAFSGDGGRYDPYGSTVVKQVYLHGSLDDGPTVLRRDYGMSWAVGGFLLTRALKLLGDDEVRRMRARVVRERDSTFVSEYRATVPLSSLLDPEVLSTILRSGTDGKYLVDPLSG